MAINNIEAFNPYVASNGKSLLNESAKKLKDCPVKDLTQANTHENAEFMKNVVLKTDKIDFNALAKQKVNESLEDESGYPLEYEHFKNFVNNLRIDKEQKTTLRDSIIASTQSVNATSSNSSVYGMRVYQTNLELKYISSNLIPEAYQEKFNELADEYTKKLEDEYTKFNKCFAKSLINTTDPALVQGGWRKTGKEMLDSLENGTNILQTSSRIYKSLYNRVDTTKPEKVKEQLNSVYTDFLTNGDAYSGRSRQEDLTREVKYLSQKWNTVMDKIGNRDKLKIPTSINGYV